MRVWLHHWNLLLAVAISITACQPQPSELPGEEGAAMSIKVSSEAFAAEEMIPKKYTCDGDDLSPPLSWSGVPETTLSLALIADDPDAPAGTWVHWVLYNLPPELTSLPQGVQAIGVEGINGFRRSGYGGPCPPRGTTHRYFFKLYGLDTQLDLSPGASKAQVEKAMDGHTLAQGQLMGKYRR